MYKTIQWDKIYFSHHWISKSSRKNYDFIDRDDILEECKNCNTQYELTYDMYNNCYGTIYSEPATCNEIIMKKVIL